MMVKAVSDYFAKKGVEGMDLAEYKSQGSDVPVKDYMLRRAFGSWKRVISAMNKRHPIAAPVEEVPAPTPAPKAPKAKKVEKKDVK